MPRDELGIVIGQAVNALLELDETPDRERSEEHTSELQSRPQLVCRLLLEKKRDLIKESAIGKVIQTVGTGPHRLTLKTRTAWFFDKKSYGGIPRAIRSKPVDQVFAFTR